MLFDLFGLLVFFIWFVGLISGKTSFSLMVLEDIGWPPHGSLLWTDLTSWMYIDDLLEGGC